MSRVSNKRVTDIKAIIARSYEIADVPLPSPENCITPLSDLISAGNLICVELPSLTSQSAMEQLLQRGGIIEPVEGMSDRPLAGFLYANSVFGAIFVEASDMLQRRRFSAAHELGHYLLHFSPLLTQSVDGGDFALLEATAMDTVRGAFGESDEADLPEGEFTIHDLTLGFRLPTPLDQMELEANLFAGELLMPESVVRAMATTRGYFGEEDLIGRLATEMLVSRAAMRWRLQELALYPSSLNGAVVEG